MFALRSWFLSVGLVAASFLPAGADPIEPQHAVYEVLRRGEAHGHVPLGFTSLRPRDRHEILAALKGLASETASPTLKLLAERHIQSLDWEAKAAMSRLTYRDSNWIGGGEVDFKGSATVADSLPRPQSFTIGALSFQVAGQYRDHLYAVSQAFVGSERSYVKRFRETYDASEGLPYNTDREGKAGIPRGVSTFDGFRTVVGMNQGPIRLEAGQDWNQWGPGVFSQTTLGTSPWFWVQDSLPASDTVGFAGTRNFGGYRRGFRVPGEAAPLPQLRLRVSTTRLEYIKVVAQRTGLKADSAAWMVAHRLVWHPRPDLSLGITELVTLAGRSPDWVYWLPLVPLKYAEHQLGDRDNIALGADASYRLPWNTLLYAEILLDDFSGFPLDFWGNKFAFTVGSHWESPQNGNTQVDGEYTLVSPWFFSHLRRDTQMQSFGALLGSALPANAHRAQAKVTQTLRPAVAAMLQGSWMQRGVGTRESALFSVHSDSLDGTQRSFLQGSVETRFQIGLGARWQPKNWFFIELWAGENSVTDWKGEPGQDETLPWFSGHLQLTY
jgi:hypothetical protein